MVRHVTLRAMPAEPPVDQVQVNLLAQPSFRADAEAVAHDLHPDQQFRIDRGAADLAVVRRQMPADIRQIDDRSMACNR